MKKKSIVAILCLSLFGALLATGCGSEEEPTAATVSDLAQAVTVDTPAATETPVVEDTTATETPVVEPTAEVPALSDANMGEGYVMNELTGLPIAASLENQRPIAVMVDNESKALPHYGVNDADVVYEMMNSTANGRVTRLMCLMKDWSGISQMGSIRSTRTTNCILAAAYNAVLCHDGGPVYINDYIAMDCVDHLSGVFSRVKNGKATEFTEYICTGDLTKYLVNSSSISTEYNQYYTGDPFKFVASDAMSYNEYESELTATGTIDLPFPHNSSELHYNASTGLYEYYEYGKSHDDAVTGVTLAFTNVLLLETSFQEYDGNGYLYYEIYNNGGSGYYLTGGKAVPIGWYKNEMCDNTVYYDAEGQEIYLNAGKTYIALVPADTWDEMTIQ